MSQKRISVILFTIYVLVVHAIRSDCWKELSEKNEFNSNLSAAVNFIIKSVNSSNVRVIGCENSFQNDFDDLSEYWRVHVSSTLLNVERKNFVVHRKIPKNDLILMFVDLQFHRCLQKFMERASQQIRKHKMVVVFKTKTEDCVDNG